MSINPYADPYAGDNFWVQLFLPEVSSDRDMPKTPYPTGNSASQSRLTYIEGWGYTEQGD